MVFKPCLYFLSRMTYSLYGLNKFGLANSKLFSPITSLVILFDTY
ncbi:hypothetical protein [Bacteriophage R18C]|uniref:Uncharacterized protein n=1 Tax=Bacteriophage R18C TaxID=2592161 RepID=A0A5P1MAU1_9CAUD|nr:hypothetical protein HYP91_gp23 [Bacteriophage R18C]QDP43517.1 hypothetical protein [Bacteriophage R18C]